MPAFVWHDLLVQFVITWSTYGPYVLLIGLPVLAVLFVAGRKFKVRRAQKLVRARRLAVIASAQSELKDRRRQEYVFNAVKGGRR